MNLTVNNLFETIQPYVTLCRNHPEQRDAALLRLEQLAETYNHQAPLHIHSYEEEFTPDITLEKLWQAALCKAAQPEEFIDGIASSQIVGPKRADGFVRSITPKDDLNKSIGEEVLLASKGILFIQHAPARFVAVNRIVERDGKLYFKGTYFDWNKERTHAQFMESASGVMHHIRENIPNGKVAALFAKHYA